MENSFHYFSKIKYKKIKTTSQFKKPNKKKSLRACILFIFFLFLFIFFIIIINKSKVFSNFFSNNILNNIANIGKKYNKNKEDNEDNIYLDEYETNVYRNIEQIITTNKCSQMWANQREFLNGVVRKFRPKKIVEIGVAEGGATSVILNAIQDIEGSHLFSIELSTEDTIGKCVKKFFPQFSHKWTLFQGKIAAYYMETIGNNIDMVMIDSAHYEPGEILDFIMVFPFLKEEALIVIHDIGKQITKHHHRDEFAPYIIFNMIRGKTYLPSGNLRLTHDIGMKKLEINKNKYIHDYFRSLGGQWQYFPKEEYINFLFDYFKKYFDNDCLIMFNETVEFNRNFVKKHPKYIANKNNIDQNFFIFK